MKDVILTLQRLWSLSQQRATNGGTYRTLSLLNLGFVMTPGMLAALQSVFFRGKLDLGVGKARGAKELGGAIYSLLAPLYLVVMPVFWIFVPVVKYLELAQHLIRVQLGWADYDSGYRERVWKARELEGLGETMLQLTMNLHLVVLTYCHHEVGGGVISDVLPDIIQHPSFASRHAHRKVHLAIKKCYVPYCG